MKKLSLLFLLVCFCPFHFFAQELELTGQTCGELNSEIDSNQNRSNIPEDNFVDRFGNAHFKEINTKLSGEQRAIPLTPDYLSPEGLFAVYLTDQITDNSISDFNNDANYRNVIAQIFADLEQLIIENPSTGVLEPVKIELQSMSTNSSVLASASSYYDYSNVASGTIVEGEVWKAINSGSNDPDNWDGLIRVNFFHTWYSDFNNPAGITGTNAFDMYAVLLHEIMHALGFASGIDEFGNPKNGRAFLKYDNLLHTDTNDDLIVPLGLDWSFNSAVPINAITNGCPSTSQIRLGDNNLPVHSPQVFSNGSSLSHVDLNNDCNYPITDFIMAYAIAVESSRRPLSQEFDILCSLNYNLSTQFGNSNIIEFANPAIITSVNNNNSNIIAYSGCEPLVFGINDFENSMSQPTVENCQGNILNILEQDLLSNDLSNLGLALEVTNLSLNGNLITTFTGVAPNRTFNISPNFVGDLQLIYQPRDTNGNLGNNTFVNIKVTMCPNFGCVNTSDCNLICNPEIDFLARPNNDCMLYGHTNSHNLNTIPGWRFKYGTTDWMLDDRSSCYTSNPAFELGRNNISLPNTELSSGRFNFYGSQTLQPAGYNRNLFQSESLMTAITLQPNTKYILSYHKSDGIDPAYVGANTPGTNVQPNIGLDVSLSNNSTSSSNLTYYHDLSTPAATLSSSSSSFANNTLLVNDDAIDFNWSQTVTVFNSPLTIDSSNSFLVFNHAIGSSYINSGRPYVTANEFYFLALDRIELIEDHLLETPNSYIVDCGATQTIGIDLCTVSNMQYEWWDITNGIQLTDLDDTTSAYTDGILNALPTTVNYSVNSINNNGSTITLSAIENSIELELRRTFPVTFVNNTTSPASTALNNINDPDNTVTVNITVLNEAPTDATFTKTSLSNCLEYTFQANSTYETHEWDFDNDGVMDVSGAGDDIANTNPSYTFTIAGTFTVKHTVSNACGSITYQEDITINCPTTCTGTSTWDGTSWDNGIPDIDTEVILNGHYNTQVNGSFSACSLIVNTGFNLQIEALDYVEIKNSTTVFGDLLVKHTGSFVQNEDSGFFQLQGAGNATVEKMTAMSSVNTEISYISSPTTNTTILELLQNNLLFNGYRYWFNTTNFKDSCAETFNNNVCVEGASDGIDDDGNDWIYADNTFVMQPGIGIVVRPNASTSIPLTFTGELNNGVISVPITRNDEDEILVSTGALNVRDDNPIYVGNPYASAISVDAFLAENYIGYNANGIMDGVVLIWSHFTPPSGTTNGNQPLNFDFGDYAMINLTGAIAGGEVVGFSGIVPNRFIPSGQGFFLHYSNAAPSPNGNIIFNNSMRVTGSNEQFFRNSNTLDNKLKLNLSTATGVHGEILLGYVEGATNNYDGNAYDAEEHTPVGQNAIIYFNITDTDKKFVIQGKAPEDLVNDEVIPVGFFNSIMESESLEFKININDFQGEFFDNQNIYIDDKLLGVCHNLSESDYSFTSAIGEFNDRFEIRFNGCETLSTTENELVKIQVFPNPTTGIVNVKAKASIKSLELFNNLGQLVLSKKGVNSLNLSNFSEGLYFLKIEDVTGNIKNVRLLKQGNL